MTADDAFK